MKKYITLLFFAAAFGFVSCDVETKIAPGGTAVEDMCGFWDVTVNGVDADGNVIDEDLLGEIPIMTYNTADNSSTQMWFDDRENFWSSKFKVNVDYANKTMSAENVPYDEAETGNCIFLRGKVLLGAGKNVHGMPADSIFVAVKYDDDDPASPYDHYTLQGVRHGGY